MADLSHDVGRARPGPAPDDHHHDAIHVPKGAIVAIGLLLAGATAMVALSQLTGLGAATPAKIEAVESYSLVFADGDEGQIVVSDGATGATVYAYPVDESGFVRTALRALIFDRQKAGIGQGAPFTLSVGVHGESYLSDPTTGQFVALNAFGGGNAEGFRPLLEAAALHSPSTTEGAGS